MSSAQTSPVSIQKTQRYTSGGGALSPLLSRGGLGLSEGDGDTEGDRRELRRGAGEPSLGGRGEPTGLDCSFPETALPSRPPGSQQGVLALLRGRGPVD